MSFYNFLLDWNFFHFHLLKGRNGLILIKFLLSVQCVLVVGKPRTYYNVHCEMKLKIRFIVESLISLVLWYFWFWGVKIHILPISPPTHTHTLRTHVGESYLTNSLLHQLKRECGGGGGGRKCSTCFSHLVSELNNQPPLLLLRLLPLPPPICCCCCGICVGQEKFCGLAAFTLTVFFFSLSLSRCTACRNT